MQEMLEYTVVLYIQTKLHLNIAKSYILFEYCEKVALVRVMKVEIRNLKTPITFDTRGRCSGYAMKNFDILQNNYHGNYSVA